MCGTNQHLIHCGGEESYEMPPRGRDVLIALTDSQQQWVPAQNQTSQNDSIDGGGGAGEEMQLYQNKTKNKNTLKADKKKLAK